MGVTAFDKEERFGNTLKIDTVHQCNCCFGNKTLHPLVSIIDLSKANWADYSVKFSFYTILLIENECDECIYGSKHYDYSNATMIFLPPGQSIYTDENNPLPRKGRLLAFHPNLICGTTLDMHIDRYTFFAYNPDEALHLSLREKTKATECLNHIEQELQYSIDKLSKTIISRYIELLLDYSSRFYERQFITRCEANKKLLGKMELLLDDYIRSGRLEDKVPPSAEYCSDILNLSPCYFRDLLKFETGKTIDLYFQLKRIETAKTMLSEGCNVNHVAGKLGFSSVQYFCKLFQKITGTAPDEYRVSRN